MSQHLDQPLRISTLCAMTGLSQSHFFALFKRMTGDSPISYFIRERMRHAAEVLANSDVSVKAIAASLGYHDPYYFSRLFKSVYQVAPSRYRASVVQTSLTASAANPAGFDGHAALGASGSISSPKRDCAAPPRTFSETQKMSVTTTKLHL